jgi:hypothetical protein
MKDNVESNHRVLGHLQTRNAFVARPGSEAINEAGVGRTAPRHSAGVVVLCLER